MSGTANDIICNFIQIATFLVFTKILYKSDFKLFDRKSILTFLILNTVTTIIYSFEYNGLNTLLFFLLIVFVLHFVYKHNILKSFLSAGLFMMTLFMADLITSIIFINFVDVTELRSKYFVYANLSVSTITILLINIKVIKMLFYKIINIRTEKKNFEIILFLVLLICALSIIMYIIGKNFLMNEIYILCIIGVIIFLILSLIFFKENYEKYKIISKYDQLFEYVTTFEEWIDNEKMNIHESKNQLATLRAMVKRNKKAVEYIDTIIKERINLGNESIEKLRYVPKGGLKGLLYYKITIAENNGISIFIDVTKSSKKILLGLSIEEMKNLCRMVGILLDNAMEAAKETKEKTITCEIYVSNDVLNIVISNPFSGNIDFGKIKNNGYSTKGPGRGKGLYIVEKLSSKYDKFLIDSRIINSYFIQRIIIKK